MKPIDSEDEREESERSIKMKGGTSSMDVSSDIIGTKDKKKLKKKKVKKEKESMSKKKGKNSKKKNVDIDFEQEKQRMEKIRSENPGVAADFIFKTMLERDPRKRRIKPVVDRILDSLPTADTSSDDSDFDPGNKKKGKNDKDTDDSDEEDIDDDDDEDGTNDTNEDDQGDNDLSSDDEDYDIKMDMKRKDKKSKDIGLAALFKEDSSMAESSSQDNTAFNNRRNSYNQGNILDPMVGEGPSNIDRKKLMKIMVCAVCSGDVSHEADEIVECDSCGISVHEHCYGVAGEDSEEEEDVTADHGQGDGDLRPVDLTTTTSALGHRTRAPSVHYTPPINNHRTPPKGSPSKSTPSTKSSKGTPPSAIKLMPSRSARKQQLSGSNNDNNSTASSASTEPWFCDPCKSGLDPTAFNPSFEDSLICELCPNPGGIFKMTVTGRWVHVVCALYIPGVAFLDTNRLDGMTLFELPPEKYGARFCSLCPDDRLARTGVTITCDAGLCKTNFHVTCAQREGLLLEAQSLNETEMVDPFYAHCKIHSNPDKINVKRRKKNFYGLMSKVRLLRSELVQAAKSITMNGHAVGGDRPPGQGTFHGRMNERSWLKLQVARHKWCKRRQQYATRYWRPQSKVPRNLSTSSLAVRTLIKKTSFFGASLVHDVDEFEEQALKNPNQGQLLMKQALARMDPDAPNESVFDFNLRKKMSSAPNFSPEFVYYYYDRCNRMSEMSNKLSMLKVTNDSLKRTETESRERFESVMKEYETIKAEAIKNRDKTRNVWNQLNRMLITHPMLISPSSTPTKITFCSKKYYPKVLESPIKASTVLSPVKPKKSLLNALSATHHHHSKAANQPTVLKSCGKCSKTDSQHLLALCDKCHLHYHLYCLDPPLTRMPKKTRFGGWQCSDCTEAQVELEAAEIANGSLDRRIDGAKAVENGTVDPRDSSEGRRLRKVPAKFSTPDSSTPAQASPKGSPPKKDAPMILTPDQLTVDGRSKMTSTGKKRGRPMGVKNGMGTKKMKVAKKARMAVAAHDAEGSSRDGGGDGSSVTTVKASKPKKIKQEKIDEDKECCKCKSSSSVKVLVQCDQCLNNHHFTCLDPPLKKSPKARGYDWFCTDCDSSDEEENDDKDDKSGSSSGSADSESDSSSSDEDENGSSSGSEKSSEGGDHGNDD